MNLPQCDKLLQTPNGFSQIGIWKNSMEFQKSAFQNGQSFKSFGDVSKHPSSAFSNDMRWWTAYVVSIIQGLIIDDIGSFVQDSIYNDSLLALITIIPDLVPHSQHVSFDSRPEPPNEYLRLTAYHDNTACSMLHFLLFYQWLESFFYWNSFRIPRSRWAISLSHWRVRRKISQTLKHPWLLMKGWINGQFHMCCFDFCQLIFWVKVHFPGKEGLFFLVFLEPLKLRTLRLILASKCWPLLRIKKHWSKNQDGFIQNHGCLVDPHFLLIQECIVVTLIKPLMLMFHDFCWLSFGGHWRVATATICREKYTSQCTYDHRNSPVPTTLLLWFR